MRESGHMIISSTSYIHECTLDYVNSIADQLLHVHVVCEIVSVLNNILIQK